MQWEVTFSRHAHDWKLKDFTTFFEVLYYSKLRWNVADSMCWAPAQAHGFTVHSFHSVLSLGGSEGFPWHSMWHALVPPKCHSLVGHLFVGRS